MCGVQFVVKGGVSGCGRWLNKEQLMEDDNTTRNRSVGITLWGHVCIFTGKVGLLGLDTTARPTKITRIVYAITEGEAKVFDFRALHFEPVEMMIASAMLSTRPHFRRQHTTREGV